MMESSGANDLYKKEQEKITYVERPGTQGSTTSSILLS